MSVILPTFNRAYVLRRALESVLQQTHRDLEVLVVDDGSNDSTPQLKKHYETYPQIRWIRSEHRGVSAARNLGAFESQGRYLAFIDSDDEWMPEKLSQQLCLMAEEERRWCHTEEIWRRKGVRVNPKQVHRKNGGWQFLRSVQLCCISPSAVLMTRELWQEGGGFREDFPVCEDYDLWLRLSLSWPISFVSTPLVIKHGGHPDQLSHRYKAMDYFRAKSLYELLRKQSLHPHLKAQVETQLQRRLEILKKGYQKHGNLQALAEIQTWASFLTP